MRYKLSDLCLFANGRVAVADLDLDTYISTENMLPNKEGITRSAGLPTITQTQAYQLDDVLVSNIRPYFKKIWHADRDGGCSNDVLVLRAKDGCNPAFLYYLLSDDKFFDYATATAKGTKMPRGDKGAIMRYAVPDLPLDTQIGIADTLSALDAKIANNTKINNHLEQMAQAIFKSWFVDFEPWGGVMPEDWNYADLESFIYFQEGPGIRNWQYVLEDGTKFINIRCIQDGDLRLDTASMISNEEANGKYRHFLLNEWDVVVSTSGTLGRYAIVRKEHLPLCLNTSVIRFVPKISFKHYSYMFSYLTSMEFYDHLQTKASGSVQANFGPMHLRQIEMLIPSDEVLRDYHEAAFPLIESIVTNRRSSQQLALLRDTLLPRLMSGELSVAEAAAP